MPDGAVGAGSTSTSSSAPSIHCRSEDWQCLFERYPCIRLEDAVTLLPGTLRSCSGRTWNREAAKQVEAGLAHRLVVEGRSVLVASPARKTHVRVLAHHVQRAMIDAALVVDGFTVSSDNDGRLALRTWLLAQPPRTDWEPLFIRRGRECMSEMPTSGPRLPYTVAWRGTVRAPSDLRLSVVLHPNISMKKQLEALPLRTLAQPRIPIILRSCGDDTTWSRSSKKLYKGRCCRSLMLAFSGGARVRGMFPYSESAIVLDYRPDLWVRQGA